MAGIYLHIPFCKQACTYCNFHFSTTLVAKDQMVLALGRELELRRDFLKGERIDSIYLGGGTPSLLGASELNFIFEEIVRLFEVSPDAEITLEANPDDLSAQYLDQLRDTQINRLSVGIQSFFEEDLRAMNRAHNSAEARECLDRIRVRGFHNFSIDLIYGMPTLNQERWESNLAELNRYEVPHVSCYALTVEPGTALHHQIAKGEVTMVRDEKMVAHFKTLVDFAQANGLQHYEISNLAKPKKLAVHNRNYWFGATYLGIGPSAHSFDGMHRSWNVAHNHQYLKSIDEGLPFHESETLSDRDQYNEYVLTRLRTMWGCSVNDVNKWGAAVCRHFYELIQPFVKSGHVLQKGEIYQLTTEGMLIADHISKELFLT